MTIEASTSRVQYATNGTTGPFAVPFYFLEDSHLLVTYTDTSGVDTSLVLTTNYSVSGAGNPAGGSVSTVTSYPNDGGKLTITRNVPLTQLADYVAGDRFPAESHETALDKQMMALQQLDEAIGRVVQLPVSDQTPIVLPTAAARANTYLGFDSDGNIIVVDQPSLADQPLQRSGVQVATEGQVSFTVPFDFTRGNNSLFVLVNGRITAKSEYTEDVGNIISVTNGLSAGDEIEFVGGTLLNGTMIGEEFNLTLPTGATPTYLQTLSQIQNGEEVSFLRFVDDSIHSAIRARSNTTDLKASFEDAFTSGVKGLYMPYGRFCLTPTTAADLNWFSLRGDSRMAAQIALLSAGDALTFSNLQQGRFSGIEFAPIGTLAASSGLVLTAATGTTMVERCAFTGFTTSGLRVVGTVGTPLSGMEIVRNLFLANEASQLYFEYSNDFWIEKNQFGWTATNRPAVGCELVNSSAGTYIGNYHWENTVNLKATSCGINSYFANRIEDAAREGVIFTNCYDQTFVGNRLYANSKGNSNTYDSLVLVNEQDSVFSENKTWDWTGGSQPHRYSYNIGSTSANLAWHNNKATGYGTAPYAAMGPAAFTTNGDQDKSWNSGALIAGAFYYLGGRLDAAVGAAEIQANRRCAVVGLKVITSTSPGAGKAFNYKLYKDGVVTAMTASITESDMQTSASGTPILFGPEERWSVEIEVESGAGVANHEVRLVVLER